LFLDRCRKLNTILTLEKDKHVLGIHGAINKGLAGSVDPKFNVLYNCEELMKLFLYYINQFRTDGAVSGTITLKNSLQTTTVFSRLNDEY